MLGMYTNFVTFQSMTLTPDTGGGNVEVPSDESTAWCRVTPKSAYTEFIHGQLKENTSHIIEMRYQTGFKVSWRVKWVTTEGTRYFAIEGVRDIESDNRRTVLFCQEQTDKEDGV
jgi:SPP1 family predicted phage head-tail adaptor